MASATELFNTSSMTAGGHYTNAELRFLKTTGRFPVASTAFYTLGDNSGGGMIVSTAQAPADQHPYVASARAVPQKIISLDGPGANNNTYWMGSYVLQNGDAYTWGTNNFNALGPRTTTNPTTPTILSGGPYKLLTNAGGTAPTLGMLKANGELWVSGYNITGNAGTGNTSVQNNARSGTALWKDVAFYGESSMGIKTDGTLWGWGSNANGRNGLGLTAGNTTTPTQIGTDTDWDKVMGGRDGGFVLKTDGRLYGFGSNTNGCLGTGDTSQKNVPTQIGTRTGWGSASKSTTHSMFVHSDGTLWSVGLGSNFRRGYTATTTSNLTQVGTETHWTDVVVGAASFIASTTAGGIWFAGSSNDGPFASDQPLTRICRTDPTKTILGTGIRHFLIGY